MKVAQPVAKKYKNEIIFGTVKSNYIDQWLKFADYSWFSVKQWPSFAIREPIKNYRYPLDNQLELSEHNLDNFVQDFLNGKVKPEIKSELLPKKGDNSVTKVVGLNYQTIVMDEEKDVLIQFCTDWCPPCKRFAPTYEILAKYYDADPVVKNQVTIATIDAEANYFPDRDVKGFPWFKFYPADRKESPIPYFGPRDLENMRDFIRDNGKHRASINLKEGTGEL